VSRPRLNAGWSFILSAALAASVAGHRVIQALGERGRLETSTYGAYAHVALGPAFVFALVAALIAACALARERRRTYAFGRNDALARDASAVARLDWSALVAYVAALQFGLLYLMETVEHLLAFGSATSGLDWLGGDVPVALAVHFTLACLAAATLRGGARDLVRACDRALALIDAFVASFRHLLARDARPVQLRRRLIFSVTPRVARRVGLRAPPTQS
jgi:hypothetical protein